MSLNVSDLLPGDLVETAEGYHLISEITKIGDYRRVHVYSLREQERHKPAKLSAFKWRGDMPLYNPMWETKTAHKEVFLRFYREGERLK